MKTIKLLTLASLFLWGCTHTTDKKDEITPIPFNEVSLTEGFWKNRMKTELEVTVPFSVAQSEPAVERFRKAAAYMAGDTTQLQHTHRHSHLHLHGADSEDHRHKHMLKDHQHSHTTIPSEGSERNMI